MHLRVVGEYARGAVGDDRARLPRGPQAIDNLYPLVRLIVAEIVLVVPVQAEILRRAVVVRSDDIEANAAVCQMIERRTQSRSDIWRVETRRDGGDDTNLLRHVGEQRHQRERIALLHGSARWQIP